MSEVCDVCEKHSDCKKVGSMSLCDSCTKDFEDMAGANDGWGEAFAEFEKAHPNEKIMECMDCGEWVALKSVTEDDYCPRCGGSLDGGDND